MIAAELLATAAVLTEKWRPIGVADVAVMEGPVFMALSTAPDTARRHLPPTYEGVPVNVMPIAPGILK